MLGKRELSEVEQTNLQLVVAATELRKIAANAWLDSACYACFVWKSLRELGLTPTTNAREKA